MCEDTGCGEKRGGKSGTKVGSEQVGARSAIYWSGKTERSRFGRNGAGRQESCFERVRGVVSIC